MWRSIRMLCYWAKEAGGSTVIKPFSCSNNCPTLFCKDWNCPALGTSLSMSGHSGVYNYYSLKLLSVIFLNLLLEHQRHDTKVSLTTYFKLIKKKKTSAIKDRWLAIFVLQTPGINPSIGKLSQFWSVWTICNKYILLDAWRTISYSQRQSLWTLIW